MKIKANCKINLGLDVLRRRDDGYHDLSTIMLPVVGLYDVVDVERREDNKIAFRGIGLTVDCADEDNICVKAAKLMQERYGIAGVDITLDKRVPFGAGLGGGSADGTAVILAINNIFSLDLTEE
ncbi:MAG: 4-(cytidine 5'-diphospho)-2-C-methyl-D-erythritol kinase, partial [Alistipes sp.]|nr:4-(cytidine 5'-diphospho)-2-C-methyl-D-erythritol kinase [Alistipes sp.]